MDTLIKRPYQFSDTTINISGRLIRPPADATGAAAEGRRAPAAPGQSACKQADLYSNVTIRVAAVEHGAKQSAGIPHEGSGRE